MFVGTATFGGLSSLLMYAFPAVRRVESDLPDHDAPGGAAELSGAAG